MDPNQIERWAVALAKLHGIRVRDACCRILDERLQHGEPNPSLLAIVREAQQEVYPDQVHAAEAAGLLHFSSDGDL